MQRPCNECVFSLKRENCSHIPSDSCPTRSSKVSRFFNRDKFPCCGAFPSLLPVSRKRRRQSELWMGKYIVHKSRKFYGNLKFSCLLVGSWREISSRRDISSDINSSLITRRFSRAERSMIDGRLQSIQVWRERDRRKIDLTIASSNRSLSIRCGILFTSVARGSV